MFTGKLFSQYMVSTYNNDPSNAKDVSSTAVKYASIYYEIVK